MTSANGVSAFRFVAAGYQGIGNTLNEGNGVGATQYMLGTMELTPQTEFYNPREERGSRIETHRVVAVARHGEMSFESSLQYQRAPMWFSMVFGNPGKHETKGSGSTVSAVASPKDATRGAVYLSGAHPALLNRTSGDNQYDPGVDFPAAATGNNAVTLFKGPSTEPKVPAVMRYTFAPEPGWLLRPAIWTMYYGDNYQHYRMKNAFVRNFEMTYAMNDAVMISAEMFGSFPVAIDPTTVLTQPLVHDAVSQFTDLYLGNVTDANLHAFSRKLNNAGTSTAYNFNSNPWTPGLYGIGVDGEIQLDAVYKADAQTISSTVVGEPSFGAADTAHPGLEAGAVGDNPLTDMRKKGLCNAISLSIPTGIEMTRYTSGSIDFTDFGQTIRTVNVDLTLRHNEAGKAEYDKYVDDSDRRRLLRLVTKGPTIAGVHGIGNKNTSSWGGFKHATNRALEDYIPYKHFIAVDMTMLYTDSPQFFTEEGGDDLYTIRGSSYHEGNILWNRDVVAYVQTNRPSLDYDYYF